MDASKTTGRAPTRIRSPSLGLLLLLPVLAGAGADPPDEIERLVQQLGSPQFPERQAASKRLEVIGKPASKALRRVASNGDAEMRRRAEALLRTITGPRMRLTLHVSDAGVCAVAISPDGAMMASDGSDDDMILWETATGKEIRRFKKAGEVMAIAFSPDGETLASGGSTLAGGDAVLKLWNVATGKELRSFQGHTIQITCVAFSPDGKTLASGSLGWRLRLWDVTAGKQTALFQGTCPILSLAFHPSGKFLAYGSTAANFDVFDLNTGQRTASLNERTTARVFNRHQAGRLFVAFSPTGKTLASGSKDRTLRVWDLATGQVVALCQGHRQAICCVAFSPDGKTLASGSEDNMINLWDAATGKYTATLEGHTRAVVSLAFSPDGKTLASASLDGSIKLWKVADADGAN